MRLWVWVLLWVWLWVWVSVPDRVSCLIPVPNRYDFLWDQPHTDRMNRKYDKWNYKKGDHQPVSMRRQLSTLKGDRGLLALGEGAALETSPAFLQHIGQKAMQRVP